MYGSSVQLATFHAAGSFSTSRDTYYNKEWKPHGPSWNMRFWWATLEVSTWPTTISLACVIKQWSRLYLQVAWPGQHADLDRRTPITWLSSFGDGQRQDLIPSQTTSSVHSWMWPASCQNLAQFDHPVSCYLVRSWIFIFLAVRRRYVQITNSHSCFTWLPNQVINTGNQIILHGGASPSKHASDKFMSLRFTCLCNVTEYYNPMVACFINYLLPIMEYSARYQYRFWTLVRWHELRYDPKKVRASMAEGRHAASLQHASMKSQSESSMYGLKGLVGFVPLTIKRMTW